MSGAPRSQLQDRSRLDLENPQLLVSNMFGTPPELLAKSIWAQGKQTNRHAKTMALGGLSRRGNELQLRPAIEHDIDHLAVLWRKEADAVAKLQSDHRERVQFSSQHLKPVGLLPQLDLILNASARHGRTKAKYSALGHGQRMTLNQMRKLGAASLSTRSGPDAKMGTSDV